MQLIGNFQKIFLCCAGWTCHRSDKRKYWFTFLVHAKLCGYKTGDRESSLAFEFIAIFNRA